MVRTKIVCTIGPASSGEATVRKMMFSGMDVVRFNFSHAGPQELASRIAVVRLLNKKYRRSLKILGDLQGHRIRIGPLKAPVELRKNQLISLVREGKKGSYTSIPFDYKGPFKSIKPGCHIFIDDGNIALEVTGLAKDSVKTRVLTAGLLKQNKGVNIPHARLEFGPISSKDIKDIDFCKRQGIDYIAQSFVRSEDDILDIKAILGKTSKIKVFAKIENREGIKNIESIIKASDGIMIARGDMGVSLPIYEIPIVQKMIIKKCNIAGKPVITATQMLESMTENLRPTRAEVTDVANAIIDGTDFVMLSAETAAGKYPVETVKMMNDIIKFTEKSVGKYSLIKNRGA
jgi:pyruvate kinase